MTAETVVPGSKKPAAHRLLRLRDTLKRTLPGARDFLVHAVAQVRIFKKAYPGIMHALLFWGVTIQIVGTAVNLLQMQLFIPLVELPIPRGGAYLAYELLMDLAGVAILTGVLMAAFRRVVLRPQTLESRWDDYYVLVLLGLIPIAGFMLEGMRLLATRPAWAHWSPTGNIVAGLFDTLGLSQVTAVTLHPFLFWTHTILGLTFIASIPFTKLRHLILTPLNVVLHPRRQAGTLDTIEDIDEAEILGVGRAAEFRPQQLLSFDACVRCGRCQEVCPVALSGASYSPCTFVQSLRQAAVTSLLSPNDDAADQNPDGTLPGEAAWSCTTCGACLTRCPAFVNPVDEVIDLRRYQVLTTGKMPKLVGDVLRNLERQGNPWGMPGAERSAWAQGLGVPELGPGEETDVLLFLGCAFAYDDRNKKVARAFVRLLQAAGVDFASLGLDEGCCGETARRLGHEYLFQIFAEQNIEVLTQVKFNRIVTQCPHCFNTLKNEYPQFGGHYQVQHYTEYLAELAPMLKAETSNDNGRNGRLTYHDSCYLGRYNQIYAAPRMLLDQTQATQVEMPRHGENSFCCGGGGGQMWLESDADTRINHQRLDDALQVQADVVATACPYCLLMFDDAIRSKGVGEQIQVLDVAELLAARLEEKGLVRGSGGNGQLHTG